MKNPFEHTSCCFVWLYLTAIIVSLFRAPLNIFRLLYGENRDEYIYGYQTYVALEINITIVYSRAQDLLP